MSHSRVHLPQMQCRLRVNSPERKNFHCLVSVLYFRPPQSFRLLFSCVIPIASLVSPASDSFITLVPFWHLKKGQSISCDCLALSSQVKKKGQSISCDCLALSSPASVLFGATPHDSSRRVCILFHAQPDVTHHPTRSIRMVHGAGKSSCAYSLYTSVCLSLRCRWTVCVYVCVRVSVLFDAVHVIYNVVLSINQSIVPATFRSLQSEESLQVFSFLTKADHTAANSVITRCIHECCSLLFNRAFGTWS